MWFYLAGVGRRTLPRCSEGIGMFCIPPAFPCSRSRTGFGKGSFVTRFDELMASVSSVLAEQMGWTLTCCFFFFFFCSNALPEAKPRSCLTWGGSGSCRGWAGRGSCSAGQESILRLWSLHLPSVAFFFFFPFPKEQLRSGKAYNIFFYSLIPSHLSACGFT